MSKIPSLKIADFSYELPDERIAFEPVQPKDQAKCLKFADGIIQDLRFADLPSVPELPQFWVVNNTKVIPARLWFETENGQSIQIFILKPMSADWRICECMVGNRKKFKEGMELILEDEQLQITARWKDRQKNYIEFSSNLSVMEAIEHFGQVPLPPYIQREAHGEDRSNYQPIFAQKEGAVAAPTASLHFTPELQASLLHKGVTLNEVTLHVSAGTFKPVTAEFANEHEMHAERFEITSEFLYALKRNGKNVLAVGTTACRVLESLYYLGEKYAKGQTDAVFVSSKDGYDESFGHLSFEESLDNLIRWTESEGGILRGETQIFIVPGFKWRVVNHLITNFHQPGSTLIMLVASFLGDDWKDVYAWALAQNYRFLSYGDGSLLKRKK